MYDERNQKSGLTYVGRGSAPYVVSFIFNIRCLSVGETLLFRRRDPQIHGALLS